MNFCEYIDNDQKMAKPLKYNKTLYIRVTEALFDKVNASAKKLKIPPTIYVRNLIEEELQQNKKIYSIITEVAKKIPIIKELSKNQMELKQNKKKFLTFEEVAKKIPDIKKISKDLVDEWWSTINKFKINEEEKKIVIRQLEHMVKFQIQSKEIDKVKEEINKQADEFNKRADQLYNMKKEIYKKLEEKKFKHPTVKFEKLYKTLRH